MIYQSNRIKAKMSLSTKEADSGRYAYIPYKLAKYSFEGDFIGWEDLSTQLWLCPLTLEDSKRFRRVGLGIAAGCQFDLKQLVDRTIHLPDLNYFFELFIQDYNGDLIDVPVLIDNYVDTGLTYPNRDSSDPASWKLVRRFFLYENISAIEGEGQYLNPTKPPTYVRFMHEARLVYELDPNEDETIYVPYLHVFYRSIETTRITGSFPTPIVMVTQWKMSVSDAKDTLLAFLIVTHILILVWVVWK